MMRHAYVNNISVRVARSSTFSAHFSTYLPRFHAPYPSDRHFDVCHASHHIDFQQKQDGSGNIISIALSVFIEWWKRQENGASDEWAGKNPFVGVPATLMCNKS